MGKCIKTVTTNRVRVSTEQVSDAQGTRTKSETFREQSTVREARTLKSRGPVSLLVGSAFAWLASQLNQ